MTLLCQYHRRRKKGGQGGGGGGGGGGGPGPPNNLGGGANIPFGPPNNSLTFSFNFYVKREKNHKCTKLKGKIIINVTLI